MSRASRETFLQGTGFALQGAQFVLCAQEFAMRLGEFVDQQLSFGGLPHQQLVHVAIPAATAAPMSGPTIDGTSR